MARRLPRHQDMSRQHVAGPPSASAVVINDSTWDKKLSLQWSLKPLFTWMKIFGFHLNVLKAQPSKWICYLGALLLIVNVVLHLTTFIFGVKRLKANGLGPNGTNLSTANLLNAGIEHLNYTCMLSGVHAVFFVVSITFWKSLCEAVRSIDQSFSFKPKFYLKCRKAVVVGMVYIALVCI